MKDYNKINFLNIEKNNLWEINFQDPATPIAENIIKIHNYVFFFLTIVLIFVAYNMYRILVSFWWIIPDNTEYSKKDLSILKSLSKIRFTHNTAIEIIWTLVPSLILVAIAIPSFGLLYSMDDVIDPDITIKVVGHQWYWSYEYSDIEKLFPSDTVIAFDSYMLSVDDLKLGDSRLLEVDNALMLPIGTYIRVNVTSADVLHCWAIPSLGIKIDAVPHRVNTGLIFLQRTGVFYGQCSEICGVNHGFMPIAIQSVTIDDFVLNIYNISTHIWNEQVLADPLYNLYNGDVNVWVKKILAENPKYLSFFAWNYYKMANNLVYTDESVAYCLSEFEKLQNGPCDANDLNNFVEKFRNEIVVLRLDALFKTQSGILNPRYIATHKLQENLTAKELYEMVQ